MLSERFQQLLHRIQGYPPPEVLLELGVLWVVVFVIVWMLRGTRGAGAIKTVALVLIALALLVRTAGGEDAYERIKFLYNNFLGFAAIALLIVFQPELRRALVRLGDARLFRGSGLRKAQIIEEVVNAVDYLSKNKIGALIALERHASLEQAIQSGTRIDAQVSRELLMTIFWPGSALHDMAVVIREDRVLAAAVQLPLAESEHFSTELGSRHRAAIGLTQEVDALVVIVSEETGIISLAERGRLTRSLSVDGLRTQLNRALARVESTVPPPEPPESPESPAPPARSDSPERVVGAGRSARSSEPGGDAKPPATKLPARQTTSIP